MVTVADLRARVVAEYQRHPLPSWPNPHPDMASPRDEEYSRVTDPERYRIVHARARAWAAVLQEDLGVRAASLPPSPGSGSGPAEVFDRGVRLVAERPDTLPLLLLERDVAAHSGYGPLAVLQISVVQPQIVVTAQPDCGCDACDSGSVDLLEAIDAAISHVVGGPFVVLRGDGWHAEWHPSGGSAGGRPGHPDFRGLMDLCRRLSDGEAVRLPRDATAFVGRSWLS